MALLNHKTHPLSSLLTLFTAYKALLLALALGTSLITDYDTSTSLFHQHATPDPPSLWSLSHRLTRWDALYYMHNAHAGRVYEQEWAFASGLPATVDFFLGSLGMRGLGWESAVAIGVAHASHLVSVLALYKLTLLVSREAKMAFISAALHIISPAGLFLSAPYSESPFSALSFLGMYVFALGLVDGKSVLLGRGAYIVLSGALFGLANVFRSNGISNGLLFAIDALQALVNFAQSPSLGNLLYIIAPLLGGIIVGAGALIPQALAWLRYCGPDIPTELIRPWCNKMIPSIYTFVQEHYWNVGFLRYWTPNQIPLFLLAAPTLALLIISGVKNLRSPCTLYTSSSGSSGELGVFVQALAAIQTLVAILAITNYHVQIISRLASGYAVWYWWIAGCLLDREWTAVGYRVAIGFTMYGCIQGALFASFLPPA